MTDLADTVIIQKLAAPTPCNVLVVDDDDLIRAHLVTLLNLAGYVAHGASSGAQALLMLDIKPCQIVLTDWEMPDMDGPSLCRSLRLRDSERYTYVVLLSVRTKATDILVGLDAGADDYVSKAAPTRSCWHALRSAGALPASSIRCARAMRKIAVYPLRMRSHLRTTAGT